jgi:hypothetical protein
MEAQRWLCPHEAAPDTIDPRSRVPETLRTRTPSLALVFPTRTATATSDDA